MANYAVNPELLQPYLPAGTELDYWNGTCYVSVVGFMFQETRLKGIKIPFHVNFEEVNLRFYVRYRQADSWRRGVVFIKEIVPKPALTWVANRVYKEKYQTLPMQHNWTNQNGELQVQYRWKTSHWNNFSVTTRADAHPIAAGSEEEFITEHYWGYTDIGGNRTSEYEVVHPKWDVYPLLRYAINVDFNNTYGNNFAFCNNSNPYRFSWPKGRP